MADALAAWPNDLTANAALACWVTAMAVAWWAVVRAMRERGK